MGAGGGATDISISSSSVNLNIYGAYVKSNYSGDIIVAGGGGGGYAMHGGNGGGYAGGDGQNGSGYGYGLGGTQSQAGGSKNIGTNNNTCYYVTGQTDDGNTVGYVQRAKTTGSLSGYSNTGSCAWSGDRGWGAGYKITSTSSSSGYGMGNHQSEAGGGGYYGGGLGGTNGGQSSGGAGGGGSGYLNTSKLVSGTYRMYCYSSGNGACPTNSSYYTYAASGVSSTATANYAKQGNGYARITYLGTNI